MNSIFCLFVIIIFRGVFCKSEVYILSEVGRAVYRILGGLTSVRIRSFKWFFRIF